MPPEETEYKYTVDEVFNSINKENLIGMPEVSIIKDGSTIDIYMSRAIRFSAHDIKTRGAKWVEQQWNKYFDCNNMEQYKKELENGNY